MSLNPFDLVGFMFSFVPLMIIIVAILIFGLIIFMIIKGVGQWSYNNSQPVLSVPARIISRRTNVSSRISNDANAVGVHHHTDTSYYIAFEVESGSRMEFQVRGNEYGLLAENDTGKLTFQGSRYLRFERK